jgi:serine/threonine protein kinase
MKDFGSQNYAAPEQKMKFEEKKGLKPTPLFDSWAAAIILFEMITGKIPY